MRQSRVNVKTFYSKLMNPQNKDGLIFDIATNIAIFDDILLFDPLMI